MSFFITATFVIGCIDLIRKCEYAVQSHNKTMEIWDKILIDMNEKLIDVIVDEIELDKLVKKERKRKYKVGYYE